ncbi:unnamed protein product [Diabrotica balteata]|uniref:Uncharacterized protein n=1 Tax=Diabrotica balteata TaxID=107213 RepID=A0A9N9X8R3_DIABA|nr:unnamed protein product [Diabrotica balteata]
MYADVSFTFTEVSDENVQTEVPEDVTINILKSRKRKACPDQWKRNVRKFLRNSGQKYTNIYGNLLQARSLGPSCNLCRLKCDEKFTLQETRQIFETYWSMGHIN